MGRLTGIEPATSGTTNRRSNQLSYNRHTRHEAPQSEDRALKGAGVHASREGERQGGTVEGAAAGNDKVSIVTRDRLNLRCPRKYTVAEGIKMTITVEILVHASVEKTWKAYVTPHDIEQWNAASDDWQTTKASVDLREGGHFSSRMEAKDGSAGFDFSGTYTKIVPHERIEYSLGDRAVLVEFTRSDASTKVRTTFDAEGQQPVEQQRAGWQAILDNLARFVEAQR
jgi:uncharacterized protein YndB with AHSA1/START domain